MRDLKRWPYAKDLRKRAEDYAEAYDRLIREADELIVQAPVMDGQPRGTKTGDPVAAAAIRRERITRALSVIEGSLPDIEPEQRDAIIENVCRGVSMKYFAARGLSISSLKRRRRVFLAGIVERAGWAETASEWRSY